MEVLPTRLQNKTQKGHTEGAIQCMGACCTVGACYVGLLPIARLCKGLVVLQQLYYRNDSCTV